MVSRLKRLVKRLEYEGRYTDADLVDLAVSVIQGYTAKDKQ